MDVAIFQENIQQSGSNRGPNVAQTGASKVKDIKLVLLGASGVGKSSIALRFVRGEFRENSDATIGAAYLMKKMLTSQQTIKFDIWDTAGQERYHSLAPMYYRGAQAAVVVYDVTNASSFRQAVDWVTELKRMASADIVIALAGNKVDMAGDKRTISTEDAQDFAERNKLIFAETSAKTGRHVDGVFNNIAKEVEIAQGKQTGPVGKGVKLDQEPTKRKTIPCC